MTAGLANELDRKRPRDPSTAALPDSVDGDATGAPPSLVAGLLEGAASPASNPARASASSMTPAICPPRVVPLSSPADARASWILRPDGCHSLDQEKSGNAAHISGTVSA